MFHSNYLWHFQVVLQEVIQKERVCHFQEIFFIAVEIVEDFVEKKAGFGEVFENTIISPLTQPQLLPHTRCQHAQLVLWHGFVEVHVGLGGSVDDAEGGGFFSEDGVAIFEKLEALGRDLALSFFFEVCVD